MGLHPAETTPLRARFIGSILVLVACTIALSWNQRSHRARSHHPHHHHAHFHSIGRC